MINKWNSKHQVNSPGEQKRTVGEIKAIFSYLLKQTRILGYVWKLDVLARVDDVLRNAYYYGITCITLTSWLLSASTSLPTASTVVHYVHFVYSSSCFVMVGILSTVFSQDKPKRISLWYSTALINLDKQTHIVQNTLYCL